MSDDAPDKTEVEAELARILASPDFLSNRGAASFLKFVVEETLAGRGDRLKAFTIATMALKRKADFDSRSDSAVRVQALRLRKLLQTWYEGSGADSALRINLIAGSYKPVFLGASLPVAPAAGRKGLDKSRLARPLALGLALVLLALVGLMTKPASPPANKTGAPPIPSLTILQPERSPPLTDMAQALEVEFSAFDNLIVKKQGGALEPRVNAYVLSLKPAEKTFAAELQRLNDGVLVWAGNFVAAVSPEATARQARQIAQTVGDAYGAIDIDALRRLNDFDGMPRGFNCTLSAFTFLKNQTIDRLRVARECLETAVAANSHDDDARAMLAIVLVHEYFYAPPEDNRQTDLARAKTLADEAFALAPRRARSYFARFVVLYASGAVDEAFAAGRTALALNGASTLFARGIGSAYVLRGETEAGLALLGPTVEQSDDLSAGVATAALGHFLRGEDKAAEALLARPGGGERALGLTLQIALCGRSGDSLCLRDNSAALRRNFPEIAADVGAAFDRMAMAPSVKNRLLEGLRAAGYFSTSAEGPDRTK